MEVEQFWLVVKGEKMLLLWRTVDNQIFWHTLTDGWSNTDIADAYNKTFDAHLNTLHINTLEMFEQKDLPLIEEKIGSVIKLGR